jgi:hypothetical protein
MGLDIYLYRFENKAESDRLEAEYEAKSDAVWAGRKYDAISEAERDECRSQLKSAAAVLGVGEYGEAPEPLKRKISRKSALHPDHMFEVGYLRSSYNDGGFNAVMRQLGVPTLYDVFGASDEYEFQPDWAKALTRALAGRESFDARVGATNGRSVVTIASNIFHRPEISTERQAMDCFMARLKEQRPDSFRAFSTRDGDFFLGDQALTIEAAIPGIDSRLGRESVVYLIVKGDKTYDWYRQAWDIVVENCEFILAQPDRDKYWLHWSS